MASTGSIGITRPMKNVTQVSPRKVSATENRLRAARLARLLANPQARCPRPPRAEVADAAVNVSGLPDGAVEVQVLGDAGVEPGRRRAPRHLVVVLEHEDVRALVGHLLLQPRVLLGAFLGVELLRRGEHLLGDVGDEPLVAPGDRLALRRVGVVVIVHEAVGVGVRIEIVRTPGEHGDLVPSPAVLADTAFSSIGSIDTLMPAWP